MTWAQSFFTALELLVLILAFLFQMAVGLFTLSWFFDGEELFTVKGGCLRLLLLIALLTLFVKGCF